jgi:diguanylate cyclase (GGDEF)-like protein/PAS domain S-box-containing protein
MLDVVPKTGEPTGSSASAALGFARSLHKLGWFHACRAARCCHRLTIKWGQSLRPRSARNLVGGLGAIVAIVTALSIPIGYCIIGYLKEADALTYKAELTAMRAAQYIYAPEAPWRYDTDQLAAISEIRTPTAAPIFQRILDLKGEPMMQKGAALAWPTFARSAPIFASGAPVGHAEVAASLRPLLTEVFLVSIGSLLLSVAAYLAFAVLPLRVVDRSLRELEDANGLLQQREEELRAWNLRLDAALEHMSQGLCLYDAQQRVVIANSRFAEIYGLTQDQVKPGTTLRQIVEARIENGLYAGANPEEYIRERLAAFEKGSTKIQRLSDGRDIAISRQPMRGGGWVTTHEDVTERERLKEQLAQQNQQLDAALNNMTQGLAMFDSEQRLMICNQRYAEMYSLTGEQVKPGTTLRQLLEYRVASGCHNAAGTEHFVDDIVEEFNRTSSDIHELADGRVINVRRRKVANGGYVVTHEDITERQKLNALLEENNRLLSERTSRLQTIIDNFPGGISFLDRDFRVVFCNEKARRLLDLPDGLFAGGPPSIESIFRFNVLRGEYGTGDPEEQVATRMALVRERQAHVLVRERPNGVVLDVRGVPLDDGGFVTTYMDITERRRSEEKIAHMALHDALTGLANRVLLNDKLEEALTRVKRGDMVAIHLLDLDHFKNVNDTLGHPAGDKLLKDAACRLRALVRETDTIARMGGDEFAILQVAISQPADATALAHRVIESVSQPYDLEGRQVLIGTSIGIAIGPADGLTSDQLMRNADLALYRAKDDGRGTYRFFEADMDAQMQERRAMEDDLRKALTAGEFELHYQPVVHLETNAISGLEALVRWRHPEKGLILPGTFIPLAEEIGFIVPLGEWVIRQACATAARWPSHLRMSVNLSPVQFKNPGLVQVVVGALATSGLSADRLELEITESALLEDSDATLATLYRLRELGVRIAMDDFGTGYSSLAYLQSFPFDRIKIDRSFIKDITDGLGSLNIVRAMAALAKGLGMETTAEGVETSEQLDQVRSEGCTEMQGFLFSRPRPANELEELLLETSQRTTCDGTASAA